MNLFQSIINTVLAFEKEPQKIGLSQLKNISIDKSENTPSIKNKDVKLSDLMRRVS